MRLRYGSQEVAGCDGHGLCSLHAILGYGSKLSPSGVKEMSVPHRAKASSAVWTSGSPKELIIGHLEGFRKIQISGPHSQKLTQWGRESKEMLLKDPLATIHLDLGVT